MFCSWTVPVLRGQRKCIPVWGIVYFCVDRLPYELQHNVENGKCLYIKDDHTYSSFRTRIVWRQPLPMFQAVLKRKNQLPDGSWLHTLCPTWISPWYAERLWSHVITKVRYDLRQTFRTCHAGLSRLFSCKIVYDFRKAQSCHLIKRTALQDWRVRWFETGDVHNTEKINFTVPWCICRPMVTRFMSLRRCSMSTSNQEEVLIHVSHWDKRCVSYLRTFGKVKVICAMQDK